MEFVVTKIDDSFDYKFDLVVLSPLGDEIVPRGWDEEPTMIMEKWVIDALLIESESI